jgi:hypothetical protein
MRTLCGFCIALLASTGLFAQNRSGFVTPLPGTPTFGSVVHPGGTSAMPGVQRTTGSVVHPGGNTPQIGIPGIRWQGAPGQFRAVRQNSLGYAYPVAVPVYVGGGYDPMGIAQSAPQQQQQAPNVIVIYPPAQNYPPQSYQMYSAPAGTPQGNIVEVPQDQLQPQNDQTEATHYILAFKDHSIYTAIAYWVDGDTLHYFTSGNTHNQVSVSLVDRDLTKRLNEGSGLEVKLPPAK